MEADVWRGFSALLVGIPEDAVARGYFAVDFALCSLEQGAYGLLSSLF